VCLYAPDHAQLSLLIITHRVLELLIIDAGWLHRGEQKVF